MCNCDLEQPSVYNEFFRRANKAHTCCECKSTIQKGEGYVLIQGLWEDEWKSYKYCSSCNKLIEKAFELLDDDCFPVGEFYIYLIEADILVGERNEDGVMVWDSSVDWLRVVTSSPLKLELVDVEAAKEEVQEFARAA